MSQSKNRLWNSKVSPEISAIERTIYRSSDDYKSTNKLISQFRNRIWTFAKSILLNAKTPIICWKPSVCLLKLFADKSYYIIAYDWMIGWLIEREVHYARLCLPLELNREWKTWRYILIDFLNFFVWENDIFLVILCLESKLSSTNLKLSFHPVHKCMLSMSIITAQYSQHPLSMENVVLLSGWSVNEPIVATSSKTRFYLVWNWREYVRLNFLD